MIVKKIDFSEEAINTIRLLAVKAISSANSGHPGIALGAAPIMYVLFNRFLNVDFDDLSYFNRDRFVLSAGHGSALLYATMLVSGYKSITIDDLKLFRQLHSKTPGHPEKTLLEGVDLGTGPLGQGVGAAVGMAIAEAHLSSFFRLDNNESVVDHYTYCLLGDGDLEEGVCHEALSIAGRYRLNKLIFLYDSNDVQLDGLVRDSTSFNVQQLCKGYGLNFIYVADGRNCKKIYQAIKKAKKSNRSTFIQIKTVLGHGSNVAGSNKAHGSPLSLDQIEQLKDNLGYNFEDWIIPQKVQDDFFHARKRGQLHRKLFDQRVKKFCNISAENAQALTDVFQSKFSFDFEWFKNLSVDEKQSTRELSGQVLNKLIEHNKHVLILNNDLSSSTKIFAKKSGLFDVDSYENQNINLGVREFVSGTISLGIEAHGGCRCVSSTFLSFSDYLKPAIRLSAINQVAPLFVFSHDSITVGEDGPTHQPIEQLAMLRTIPNVNVFRPSNLSEMVIAFFSAFSSSSSPTVIVTSRIAFQQFECSFVDAKNYAVEVLNHQPNDQLTIVATGSEVATGMEVAELLQASYKISARVVSINCLSLFCKQSEEVQKKIWGTLPIFIIEFANMDLWKQFSPNVFGINNFGLSAPVEKVVDFYGLTPGSIANKIVQKINGF